MAFEKLTRTQLNAMSGGTQIQEYVEFLASLSVGEGGKTTTGRAKVGRQTIKNRLNKAAEHLGMEINFLRSKPEEVVFEVVR